MERVEPRGDIEEQLLKEMARAGWSITAAQRDGADLDISIDVRGVVGRVRLRHGSHRAQAKLGPTEKTSPCFVRVDLGEPLGEPEQWAIWDRYKLRDSKYAPKWWCVVVHEAIGEHWASVAGNVALPNGASAFILGGAEALVARAEALSPGRDPAARREAIIDVQRNNYGPQRHHRSRIITGLCLVLIPSALFALALSSSLVLLKVLFLGVFWFSLVLPGLIVLIANLLAVRRKEPLEGSRALSERMRKTGAFDVVKLARTQHREGFPVVVQEGRHPSRGSAPLWICRMTGKSRAHPIRLEADLCVVKWPQGTHEDCRLLPDRWLLVDLTGPNAEMSRVPSGPRETRRDGHARWLFTGEELDRGLADELLRGLVKPAEGASGPYR
jgi:hypothetical protein